MTIKTPAKKLIEHAEKLRKAKGGGLYREKMKYRFSVDGGQVSVNFATKPPHVRRIDERPKAR